MAVSYPHYSIGLVDSHCHLNLLKNKYNKDIAQIVHNARLQGVSILQTVCTNLQEIEEIIKIAESFDEVLCTVGLHPCNVLEYITDNIKLAEKLENLYETLLSYTDHCKVIGIGETGLDYYHHYSEELKKAQIGSFEKHIILSQKTNLPVIIHTRNAEEDTAAILQSLYKNRAFKGVMHCFTGSKQLAKQALDLGLYISASGIVTFKNASEIRELFQYIPIDRLLIETDSPYLAPNPYRGQVNEPSFVHYIAEAIAQIRDIEYQEVVRVTYTNFCTLFNISSK